MDAPERGDIAAAGEAERPGAAGESSTASGESSEDVIDAEYVDVEEEEKDKDK